MKNPCYKKETRTDCTKRHPGCGATCKDWADYVAERDAEYDRRFRAKAQERHRISNHRGRNHQEKKFGGD